MLYGKTLASQACFSIYISLPGMLQYILATDVQLGAVYLYEEADYLVPLIVLHLLLFCTVGPV